jgi:hypothetical protein
MSAIGYFRVSTKEQAEKNNSVPVQEGKFSDHCSRNGERTVRNLVPTTKRLPRLLSVGREGKPQLQRNVSGSVWTNMWTRLRFTQAEQVNRLKRLVGERGFEPPTPWSRTRCSTRLSHSPTSG